MDFEFCRKFQFNDPMLTKDRIKIKGAHLMNLEASRQAFSLRVAPSTTKTVVGGKEQVMSLKNMVNINPSTNPINTAPTDNPQKYIFTIPYIITYHIT